MSGAGNVLMRREQEVPAELSCHLLVLEAVEKETRLASTLPAH